jgi:hypothetical protein
MKIKPVDGKKTSENNLIWQESNQDQWSKIKMTQSGKESKMY